MGLGILIPVAEGGEQFEAMLGEGLPQARHLKVAVADDHAAGACWVYGEIFRHSEFLPVARCHLDLAEDTRRADAGVHTEAVKGPVGQVIVAIGSLTPKPAGAWGAGELTHRQRQTIKDGKLEIMRDLAAQPLPELVFHGLKVRGLAHKHRPVQVGQGREEVEIVTTKVGEDRAILLQAKVLAHHF